MVKHTAIVYFHGIGTQRRHEEISRLLDAIDQYSRTQDGKKIGYPRGQKVEFEVNRRGDNPSDDEPVSYIGFHRRVIIPKQEKNDTLPGTQKSSSPFRGAFRLYEGYWSSIIAQGLPARDVLIWIAKRGINPISSIRAPWRSHQRLKLGYLFRLHKDDPKGNSENNSIYRELADAYIKFESWDARRKFAKGQFKQFIGPYLAQSKLANRKDFVTVRKVANRWYRRFLFSQLKIFLMIVTLFVGLFGAVTFALYSIAPLLSASVLNIPFSEKIASMMPAQPDMLLVTIMVPILFVAAKVGRGFLRSYVSDVVFWTAQEGKSDLFEQRQTILNKAVSTLDHVLSDKDCERVVVIGHSLGSSVGYQALLELWKRREAIGLSSEEAKVRYPYEKVSHFITAGSPIETLHYFFELTDSEHHRYNRIANRVKGSIEGHPFILGRKKSIHWINLHAAADSISSELFSPGKSRKPDIEEFEVVSQFEPNVGKAHSGYFTATTSIARIHDAIMLDDDLRTTPKNPPKWVVPIAQRVVRAYHLTIAVLAWILFLASILFWLGKAFLLNCTLIVFLAIVSFVAISWCGLLILNRSVPLNISDQEPRSHAA